MGAAALAEKPCAGAADDGGGDDDFGEETTAAGDEDGTEDAERDGVGEEVPDVGVEEGGGGDAGEADDAAWPDAEVVEPGDGVGEECVEAEDGPHGGGPCECEHEARLEAEPESGGLGGEGHGVNAGRETSGKSRSLHFT